MTSIVAQLDNASCLFGRFPALRQVSASFEAGRCYLLLGENGAGKSTLLRVLAGLIEPTSGTASLFFPGTGDAQRAHVGYMGHASMVYDELSAVENLRYFARLYRTRNCLTPEAALRSVGLDPILDRPVGQYSQGMRQRTSLARVLLPQPELLLLDEPFSNMDTASVRRMVDLLAGLRAGHRTIILTTHQRNLAEPLADCCLTMEAGRLTSITHGNTGPASRPAEIQPS